MSTQLVSVKDTSFNNRLFPPGTVIVGEYVGCNLSSAVLEDTHIKGVFIRCQFTETSFRRANVWKAVFIECNFPRAEFNKTNFCSVRFLRSSFFHTNFTGAVGLTGCLFDQLCRFSPGSAKGATYELDTLNKRYLVRPALAGVQQDRVFTPYKLPGTTPLKKPEKIEYTDPEPLPEPEHYRSPQNKVEKSKKEAALADEDGEEDAYIYGYYVGASQVLGTLADVWGHGRTAVLECPDIQEYRKYKAHE